MKLKRKFLCLFAVLSLAGVLLTPAQLGAQGQQLCDGLQVTIMGTPGDDVLTGTPGPDVIFAAQGNDIIFGFAGDDVICAGQGNDIVVGGQGFDVLFGAQGNDVMFAADGSSKADRTDSKGARMYGGAGNDLIVGSTRWDRMQGGIGVDNLAGFEGKDWMRGGGGNDFLDGGGNADDMNGGNGADRMLSIGGDTLRGSNGNDLCAVTGQPALQLSCTTNPNAYATARHEPVTPPTRSGVLQITEYTQDLINARASVKFADLWATGCENVTPGLLTQVWGQNDEAFGTGWTLTRQLNAATAQQALSFSAPVSQSFFSSNGSPLGQNVFNEVFLYEDGAWRQSVC